MCESKIKAKFAAQQLQKILKGIIHIQEGLKRKQWHTQVWSMTKAGTETSFPDRIWLYSHAQPG